MVSLMCSTLFVVADVAIHVVVVQDTIHVWAGREVGVILEFLLVRQILSLDFAHEHADQLGDVEPFPIDV